MRHSRVVFIITNTLNQCDTLDPRRSLILPRQLSPYIRWRKFVFGSPEAEFIATIGNAVVTGCNIFLPPGFLLLNFGKARDVETEREKNGI